MTPRQALLIKDSFDKFGPHGELAAKIFYDHLFEIAPDTREMFPEDMTGQYHKFMAMFRIIVGTIDRFDELEKQIRGLGARHANYHARDEHFGAVGDALLMMLQKRFGKTFTPELKYAWTAAYWRIAQIMQEAAEEATRLQARANPEGDLYFVG